MKKYALAISLIGLAVQCFGAGFMLYGVNNSESLYTTGTLISLAGLALIAVGLITLSVKKK